MPAFDNMEPVIDASELKAQENKIRRAQRTIDKDFVGQNVVIWDRMAGVFVGKLLGLDVRENVAIMADCRKVHYWTGSQTVQGMAARGCGPDSRVTAVAPINVIRDLREIMPLLPEAVPTTLDAVEWGPASLGLAPNGITS